jgi:chromosome segregation ATPase
VIQFALLFGLGFLTAVLLVCLVAPAIHRRIVWFTEKRLRATMPLSPQEVRAQKDMARALYAAENAKTEQALSRERGKGITLQLQQEALKKEAGRLASESEALHGQIDDMSVEASDLRSRLRREESNISQLKSGLRISEQAHAEQAADIDTLGKRIDRMAVDADNLKIDLATRETEVESLRFRFNNLRTERDTLRGDIEAMTTRAMQAEMRLSQEEIKVTRLEDKLNREVAANADRQTMIERRTEEVSRLKEKLKTATTEAREAARASRRVGNPTKAAAAKGTKEVRAASRLQRADGDEIAAAGTAELGTGRDIAADIARLSDDARNRSNALSDRLLKSRSTKQDAALREEIVAIAADMVALTALAEGERSPIHALLSAGEDTGSERVSLADRASALLEKPPV